MPFSVLPWARNRLELVHYKVSYMKAAAPDCMTGVQHGSQKSCRPCNHTCNLNRLKLCTQLHQQHTHLSRKHSKKRAAAGKDEVLRQNFLDTNGGCDVW